MTIIGFTSLYVPISVDKGNLLDWSRLSPAFMYVLTIETRFKQNLWRYDLWPKEGGGID